MDRLWKDLISAGNRAYAANDPHHARLLYEEALVEAERLFDFGDAHAGTIPAPVIYNIICHNLAVLFETSGGTDQARQHYQHAYDRLIETARSPGLPRAARLSCVQHLMHALTALVQHLHRHQCPQDQISKPIAPPARCIASRIIWHRTDAPCPPCLSTAS